MLDTVEGVSGYTQIHCIWLKSGYNKIQSLMHLMNLGLDTMRYNVSGPSLDTMDTHLASRAISPAGCLELHVGCRARCQTKLLTPDVRRQKEAITVHLLEQGWLGTRLVVVQAQQWPLFRVEVHR